jgi:PPOX class probable F420-dependent enzyme
MDDAPPLELDPADPDHASVLERLRLDEIGWFTSVRADGRPHAVPVWFLWHRGRVVVLSEPGATKVATVRRGSPVLLHLHTRDDGDGVVILSGRARISERPAREWLPEIRADYTAKYATGMAAYGMGLDAIAERFHVVIEMVPTALQTW